MMNWFGKNRFGWKVAALALLLTSAPVCTARAEADIMTGLVGHWKLDEASGTLADSAGGFDGTPFGALAYGAQGRLGDAATFNGTDTYIVTSNNSALDPAIVTVCAWVNRSGDGAAQNWQEVMGNGQYQTQGWHLNLEPEDTNATFFVNRAGARDSASFNLGSTLGWHHYCGVFDGTNAHVYVDGSLGDTSVATSLVDSTRSFHIGDAGNGDGSPSLDGDIDDVRIYNRVLTAEDIAYLYSSVDGNIKYDTDARVPKFFDGNDWQRMGAGKYNPNAVDFEPTTPTYLSHNSPLTGVSDSKLWSGSVWFKYDNPATAWEIFDVGGGSADLSIVLIATGDIQVEAENSAGVLILDVSTPVSTPNFDDNAWHHLLFSFDLSDPAKRHLYVDSVDQLSNINTYVDDVMDFTPTAFSVGATTAATIVGDGQLADMWIDFGTYIDFSVEANRLKFIDANGGPVYLGDDGSRPTRTAPDIFLSGDTADWHTNKGTGGGFTENGALTDALTSPIDASSSGAGYFVEGPNPVDANLGGISGASATCLSDLQSASWLGKADAQANGQLTASNVRAWLCTTSECQNLVPNKTYTYASILNSTAGGATMTASAEGYTEDDGLAYANAAAFGAGGGLREYWTGRETDNTPSTTTCVDWTSNSNAINSSVAVSDTGYYPEKLQKYTRACDSSGQRFICIVDPPACSPAGAIQYNADNHVMQYCDGKSWNAIGAPIGSGTGGCTNPTRAEGAMIFNKDFGAMQYCDGDDWISVGGN